MQCPSCGATLQPGVTRCPSCGATVAADTSDSSPYEGGAKAVPYIPYVPLQEKEAAPASSPLPVQGGSRGIESFVGTPPQQAVSPADSGSQAQVSGVTQPPMVQQGWPLQLQVVQPIPQRRRGPSASVIALSIILALLIIGGSSGLIYYATGPYPAELHTQATAVVQNILTAQAQANAQATASIATLTPQELYTRVTMGKPAINDPLNNRDTTLWVSPLQAGPPCSVIDGSYHAKVSSKGHLAFCGAPNTDFQDFAFQVQVTIVKGDGGGLTFRTNYLAATSSTNQIQSYFFDIDQSGDYHLFTLQGAILSNGVSPAIRTGLNQPNLVAAIVYGKRLYLYVNKQFVTNVSDNTYQSGGVGLFALDVQNPTEVVFSNAQVWTL
jgi:hypothetical protein